MSDNKNEDMPPPMLPSCENVSPVDGALLPLVPKQLSINESKSIMSNNIAFASTTNVVASSTSSTPASSITGGPTSRLRAPTNYSGDVTAGASKIGRLCLHATPKAGPPPRDTKSMSRESDDNLSSINSAYTDLYQETVKRFTRSSLSPEMDRYSSSRQSTKSLTTSQKSVDGDHRTSYDLYLEATGRRHSSDHGAVLTQDTEQFIIGQKVWVGGIRPGQIAYIGETHFAPGDWAGVVLDEPNGKNDGCVAGKRYFQCEPKRGIFSRLTRLTLGPLSGAQTPNSPLSKMSPDRSRTVSPTASIRSSFLRSPGKNGLAVGDRIIVSSGFGSRPGILRYLGETRFASGNWCGVELDEPSGKNDGSVDGIKYFECRPKYGVFVPIAKVSLSPSSKKSRLSRTGSRESLNSIGTMNSIATTNTSRLRMNAQRKPLSFKPIVVTPKSQYSMQDLLQEKQKHIEQLMIERELDREDCQNQALQYQKNINELKSRITQLERSLDDERKKSEDLQFSIDEATYCGNDVQSHGYKEKIQDLEKKISELTIASDSACDPSKEDTSAVAEAAKEKAILKITDLTLQLNQRKKEYEDDQKRMQENIEYLRNENETLQKELLHKDETLENFTLSACGIQNLQHEMDLLKEETEKERQQLHADFALKLEDKDALLKTLRSDLTEQKNNLSILESERSNVEDECEILRMECKTRDAQLQNINEQLAKLKAEFSMQKAENSTLEELLKAQQTDTLQSKTKLEEKFVEIEKLKEEINKLNSVRGILESEFKSANEQITHLSELQKDFDYKLKVATNADEDKVIAMNQMGIVMEELKKQITAITVENGNLKAELDKEKNSYTLAISTEAELRKLLEEQERIYKDNIAELQKSNSNLEKNLKQEQNNFKENLNEKVKEAEVFRNEVDQLQKLVKSLESDSSASVQQLNSRINDLESQAKRLQKEIDCKTTELKVQTESFAQQNRILTEKNEKLISSATALEIANKLANKLKIELETTLIKCSNLDTLNKEQTEKCAQQQLEIGDLKRKLESINLKCDSLGTQNQELENNIQTLRTTITELQTEICNLNEELAMRQKNLLEMQTNSNDERLKLELQLEEISQKLLNSSKNLKEEHSQSERTRIELSKKNVELSGLEEKSIKLELTLSDSQRQYENLLSKYETLITQNKTLEEDLITLRTTSTDSNVELIKMTQNIAAKQKAYEELLDKTNLERAILEGQLQASQQRIDTLCSQIETLTQEMKITTEESFKRFESLKLEQEKSGKQELELGNLSRKLDALTIKCSSLESENESLQKDLITLRNSLASSNEFVNKLTTELAQKQKQLQDITDKTTADSLQLANQLQEMEQRLNVNLQDKEQLRTQLQEAVEAKTKQTQEFEMLKLEIQSQSSNQLSALKEKEEAERKKIIENCEIQLKGAEQTKGKLDEAISSLQQQIKLLQDELLKSQLDFKSKEEELNKQLTNVNTETERLRETLQQVQTEGSSLINNVNAEKENLQKRIENILLELQTKEDQLILSRGETEQLKLKHSNTLDDVKKLHDQIKTLQNANELANNEVEYRVKLGNEDKSKIEELRNMVEAVQTVNANISSTNAEMSKALQALEQEKCETTNIFEIFEMESDQNMEKLGQKLMDMKQQLVEAQTQLQHQLTTINEKEIGLENVGIKLEASQTALATVQSKLMDQTINLNELTTVNIELKQLIEEKEQVLQQKSEVQNQLAEYKNVIDEMDAMSIAKNEELNQLRERIKHLEEEGLQNMEIQNKLKTVNKSLQRKLEVNELEKTHEIVALQTRLNDLQTISKLKPNNLIAGGDNAPKDGEEREDSIAQINFLNSIIADMQKKNDTLKAKIEALEAPPIDFTQPKAFDLIAKRKPAPRVFCDICDEFDKHETEDCPLQASDDRDFSPPPLNDPADKKDRKLPEPRKYCETCEVFGHEIGECDNDEW